MAEPAAVPPPAAPTPERVLLIKAKGGLGNRMLSAVTGLIYADLCGRVPVIDWRDGIYAAPGVNAYPLLFTAPDMPDPALFDARTDVAPAKWQGRMAEHPSRIVEGEHNGALVYRKSCIDITRTDHDADVAVFWSYVPKVPRLRRLMARDPRFAGRSRTEIVCDYLTRYFSPNDRVQRAVDAVFAGLERPVIGAHLRYTDMAGPLDKVKAELARLRAMMPDAPIFLATDSFEAQEDIRAAFGNLHVTEKYLPEDGGRLHLLHDSVDPVVEAENAMIDMWALGACDWLIYSRNSTFSGTSALIGGLPADRLVNVDRFSPRIMAKRFVQDYL